MSSALEKELVPLNKPSTSEAVRDKSRGKQGPTTKEGRTVTRSILFSAANSHAAFSANTFASGYQIFNTQSPKKGHHNGTFWGKFFLVKLKKWLLCPYKVKELINLKNLPQQAAPDR